MTFFRILIPLAVVVSVAPVAEAQWPENLNGRWVLRDRPGVNTTSADTTSTELAPPAADSARPPGRPGDARQPGRRDRRGRGISERDQRQLNLLAGMSGEVRAFELVQDDSTIVITNESGFTYTLFPDGSERDFPLSDTIMIEVKTSWKDDDLVVEWKPDGGGKMTEVYSLADSRLYLRLEVTIEHGRLPQPIWRSRMYRLAADE